MRVARGEVEPSSTLPTRARIRSYGHRGNGCGNRRVVVRDAVGFRAEVEHVPIQRHAWLNINRACRVARAHVFETRRERRAYVDARKVPRGIGSDRARRARSK